MSRGLIEWLFKQSAAVRGVSVPLESTCATLTEYQDTYLAGGTRTRQVLSVRYPRPTPATVQMSLALGTGQPNDAFAPIFFAAPPLPGSPFDPAYIEVLGFFWIQWSCGGARYSLVCDLGAGAVSLPAVEEVTVRYATFVPLVGALGPTLSVSVLPCSSPGAVAIHTRLPVLAAPLSPVFIPFRQQWVRRWCASASQVGGVAAPTVASGPAVVRVIDNFSLGLSSEQLTFLDFGGAPGVSPTNQTWIESRGPAAGYLIENIATLGPGDIHVKLTEQIQVG